MIFLWEAGQASGTAGSPESAFETAAPFLDGGVPGIVEEAEHVMKTSGAAGLVPEFRRTGRAWHGRMEDGKPAWEQVTPDAGPR